MQPSARFTMKRSEPVETGQPRSRCGVVREIAARTCHMRGAGRTRVTRTLRHDDSPGRFAPGLSGPRPATRLGCRAGEPASCPRCGGHPHQPLPRERRGPRESPCLAGTWVLLHGPELRAVALRVTAPRVCFQGPRASAAAVTVRACGGPRPGRSEDGVSEVPGFHGPGPTRPGRCTVLPRQTR